MYEEEEEPTFILTVPTFAPGNVSKFVEDFQKSMEICDQYESGKLVV